MVNERGDTPKWMRKNNLIILRLQIFETKNIRELTSESWKVSCYISFKNIFNTMFSVFHNEKTIDLRIRLICDPSQGHHLAR